MAAAASEQDRQGPLRQAGSGRKRVRQSRRSCSASLRERSSPSHCLHGQSEQPATVCRELHQSRGVPVLVSGSPSWTVSSGALSKPDLASESLSGEVSSVDLLRRAPSAGWSHNHEISCATLPADHQPHLHFSLGAGAPSWARLGDAGPLGRATVPPTPCCPLRGGGFFPQVCPLT